MNRFFPILRSAPLGLLLAPLATAQSPSAADLARLTVPFPTAYAELGSAMELSGEWAVVGAPGVGNQIGEVYVYRRQGISWSMTQQITAPNGGGRFGHSVSIMGDVLLVGSPKNDTTSTDAGSVTVYVLDPNSPTWVERQTLQDATPAASDQFGFALAASDGWLAIGNPLRNITGGDQGNVALFERDRSGTQNNPLDDTWAQSHTVQAPQLQNSALFGRSVALSGQVLVVGAPYENSPASNSGAAYVFEENGGTFGLINKLFNPSSAGGDFFGWDVDVDEGTLVIGSPKSDINTFDEGKAFIYRKQGALYNPVGLLSSGNVQQSAEFGHSVAVSGNRIAVGSPYQDTDYSNPGGAQIFREGGLGWQTGRMVYGFTQYHHDNLGLALDLDGDELILGAFDADFGATDAGTTFAYRVTSGDYPTFLAGDGSSQACPCGNDSIPGLEQGCENSLGFGAHLAAFGDASAANDEIRLSASNLPLFNPALLFTGEAPIAAPFGDGLRGAGGFNVRRSIQYPGTDGVAVWGPGLGTNSPWMVGTTWYFQAWYRDPIGGPCGSGYNLSNGVAVTFQ